ncbi:unnamed protein product [Vicia faba]|uniref:Uncharacterized protein n=1 Tax=Vicia faba TaxID=3906 RepID=A0AAV1BBE8_VICFA|nr:unnamed protein product [Vicia faba]
MFWNDKNQIGRGDSIWWRDLIHMDAILGTDTNVFNTDIFLQLIEGDCDNFFWLRVNDFYEIMEGFNSESEGMDIFVLKHDRDGRFTVRPGYDAGY